MTNLFSRDEVAELVRNLASDGAQPGLDGAVLQLLRQLQMALPSTQVSINENRLVIVSTRIGNFVFQLSDGSYEDPDLDRYTVVYSHQVEA